MSYLYLQASSTDEARKQLKQATSLLLAPNIKGANLFAQGTSNRQAQINQTTNLRSKDNSQTTSKTLHGQETHYISSALNLCDPKMHEQEMERVRWVIEEVDYTKMTDKQIANEYKRLRKQLQRINFNVAKALESLDHKHVARKQRLSEPNSLAKVAEVRDKEKENNRAVIDRLCKEYMQLQKRLSSVSDSSTKQSINSEIAAAKESILKTKTKIRDLQFKNKNMGNAIVGTDNFFGDIKKLESQRQVQVYNKRKMQTSIDHQYQQISASQLRLEEIESRYQIAHSYFQEFSSKSKQEQQAKMMENKLWHAKHSLEVMIRKNEGCENSQQQRYHMLLKNLSMMIVKIEKADQKISAAEVQILHKKRMMLDLSEMLSSRLGNYSSQLIEEPIFFTEFEENKDDKLEANNQEKVDSRNESEATQEFPSNQNYGSLMCPKTIRKQLDVNRESQLEDQSDQTEGQKQIELHESQGDREQQLSSQSYTHQEKQKYRRSNKICVLEESNQVDLHELNQTDMVQSNKESQKASNQTSKQESNQLPIEQSNQSFNQASNQIFSEQQKTRSRLRQNTNPTVDLEQQQDQIMDLEDKFDLNHRNTRTNYNLTRKTRKSKKKFKSNANTSNEFETEFGSSSQIDLAAIEDSNDEQLVEFKEKVCQQRKKSGNDFDLDCNSQIKQINKFINSIDVKKLEGERVSSPNSDSLMQS